MSRLFQPSRFLAVAALWVSFVCVAFAQEPPLDLLIRNARIVDGSGNPWYRGVIGIRDGLIVSISPADAQASARRVIDVGDQVVAPGFIDLMGQETLVYLQDPITAQSRLWQGITTHVSGEGWSHAPQNEKTQRDVPQVNGKPVRWRSYAEYFQLLEQHGLPINVAHNVGASQIREVVMGEADRAPTPSELGQMKRLVAEAMQQGAGGLSTALIYPPGSYAKTEELIELAKVAAEYGGFYSTHMRNESAGLLASVDEAIRIGREARIPVHIYHLKAAGKRNWPLMAAAIKRIEAARVAGLDVTADIYPYVRNGIDLFSLLPPSHFTQGKDAALAALANPAVRRKLRASLEDPQSDWENWYQHTGADWDKVLLTSSGEYPRDLAGLSIAAAARKEGKDVWDMFFELAREPQAHVAPESMDEEQKRLALRAPWMMIETDTEPVNPATAKSSHPRAFGAFPRVLAKYVREEGVLPLEDAIRRMTSLPANRLGLYDRGRIAAGMAADLVVFDPAKIRDRATFEQPLQYSEGVSHLIMNGQLVIDAGRITPAKAGRILRHRASSAATAR